MALPIDTINSYIKEKVVTDGFVQQVFTKSPALEFMRSGKAHIKKKGGKVIKVGLEYATAGSFGAWAGHGEISLPTDTNETATEGSYNWGYYIGKDIIKYNDWLEVEESEDAVADFAQRRLSLLADGISRAMEANLFTPYDGTNHTVFGIPDVVSDADPTNYSAGLGNISVADMTDWKAHIQAYDSSIDLAKQMYKMWQWLTYYSESPTIIFTTMDILNKFAFENYDKSGYLIADKIATSAGFKSGASFQGVPFVVSDQVPAGTIYFLNTKYLKLVTHPSADFQSDGWQKISTTNLDYLNLVKLVYSIVCSKRNAQGAITGVTT